MRGTENNDRPDPDEHIVPVQFVDPSADYDEINFPPPVTPKHTGTIVLSTALFFVVLIVIFVLPRHLQMRPDLDNSENNGQPTTNQQQTLQADMPVTEPVFRQTEDAAELRYENQTQLEQALALVVRLETHNVLVWAANDFNQARGNIELGEKAYREQRYGDARKYYTIATTTLESIEGRLDSVIFEAIEDGFLQLEAKDSATATKAFNFVLSIQSRHDQAIKGLARAQTLDQVLALINEAEGYEKLNNLPAALTRYREALKLDAEAPSASSAILRIKSIQFDNKFQRIMSTGFAAFELNDDARAKAAFENAKKLKPHSNAVNEALTQVNNRILANRISKRLIAAIAFEKQEEWVKAGKQFRLAITLDANLDGAANSARQADRRAKLDQQLDTMIGQPHRLGTNAVHAEAQALLKTARSISTPGPVLQRQITSLERAIVIARTPLPVTLVSDNATEVTLYKIGPLGKFDQHSVSLIPGQYVVVGKRAGFRNVRVEFEVSPEQQDALITVQCEEKLAFGT